eukprot:scaffold261017_cov22-Prasinocladus_malaysianus.AAC.1
MRTTSGRSGTFRSRALADLLSNQHLQQRHWSPRLSRCLYTVRAMTYYVNRALLRQQNIHQQWSQHPSSYSYSHAFQIQSPILNQHEANFLNDIGLLSVSTIELPEATPSLDGEEPDKSPEPSQKQSATETKQLERDLARKEVAKNKSKYEEVKAQRAAEAAARAEKHRQQLIEAKEAKEKAQAAAQQQVGHTEVAVPTSLICQA